jgi:hypothetical protein
MPNKMNPNTVLSDFQAKLEHFRSIDLHRQEMLEVSVSSVWHYDWNTQLTSKTV